LTHKLPFTIILLSNRKFLELYLREQLNMCEFCVKHGDGKKWYLAMENYSRELLHQQDRIGYMSYFANTFEERISQYSKTFSHTITEAGSLRSNRPLGGYGANSCPDGWYFSAVVSLPPGDHGAEERTILLRLNGRPTAGC